MYQVGATSCLCCVSASAVCIAAVVSKFARQDLNRKSNLRYDALQFARSLVKVSNESKACPSADISFCVGLQKVSHEPIVTLTAYLFCGKER